MGWNPAWSEPRVIQQVDINEVPLSIQEHRGHPGWCSCCQKLYKAPLPIGIERGGLVGPKLTTLIAYLKGVCHASFSTIRKFIRDVVRLTISRGQLSAIIGKVTRALEQPYQELLDRLPDEEQLNVDETGHKQNRLRMWTWCFRAELYTLFKIDPTRSTDVLIKVLGTEFDGVLGCDYFSSYRSYMDRFDVTIQFCLAHLIRDVKFLTTLPDARDRAYGERLREALRELFQVIHRRELLGGTVPEPIGVGPVQGSELCHTRRAGDKTQSQHGGPVREAWRELFPVHYDSGSGADEQPGGASDPLRGDRPTDHARDEE